MVETTTFKKSYLIGTKVTVTMPLIIKKYLFLKYKFQKWNDGYTGNVRTITIDSLINITAIYKFSWL